MNKQLERAEQSLSQATAALCEALCKANATEALLLLPLIKRASEVQNDAGAILSARIADQREGRPA